MIIEAETGVHERIGDIAQVNVWHSEARMLLLKESTAGDGCLELELRMAMSFAGRGILCHNRFWLDFQKLYGFFVHY